MKNLLIALAAASAAAAWVKHTVDERQRTAELWAAATDQVPTDR